MQPEIKKYLYDIQEACRKLDEFTKGRSLENYLADEMLRSAVKIGTSMIVGQCVVLRRLSPTVLILAT